MNSVVNLLFWDCSEAATRMFHLNCRGCHEITESDVLNFISSPNGSDLFD